MHTFTGTIQGLPNLLVPLALSMSCTGNDDTITLKADDNADTLTLMFETPNQERVSDFDLKLMSIESEHLGIPDQEHSTTVRIHTCCVLCVFVCVSVCLLQGVSTL